VADQVMTIRIRTKADGTVEIENVAKGLDKLGKEGAEAARGADQASRSMQSLSGSMSSAASAVKAFIGAWAIKEVVTGAASLVRTGIEYNSMLEQSRLGIASLVSSFGEIVDAQGRRVEGEAAWQASLAISEEMQERLKIKALQTTAEYEDLVQAMQFSVGPALQAAFDPEQIVEFTTAVAQSAGAIGVPMQQLGQEIRALFQGDIGPDSRLAQMFFSGQKNVRAFVQELKDSGKFYDFMMEKMSSFTRAGEEMSNTFGGALSNLKDAFSQALGAATEDHLSPATQMLRELTAEIVHFDEAGNATFNEDFLAGVEAIATAFFSVAKGVVQFIQDLDDLKITYGSFFEAVKQSYKEAETFRTSWKSMIPGADAANRADLMMGFGDRWIQIEREMRAEQNAKRAPGPELHNFPPTPKPTVTAAGGGSGGGEDDAARKKLEKLDEMREDYLRWVEDFRTEAEAAGDPLAETLAKIEKDRRAAIDKLEDTQKKLKGVISPGQLAADREMVNAGFDDRAQRAIDEDMKKALAEAEKALLEHLGVRAEINAQAVEDHRATEEMRAAITASIEEERIAAIKDVIEREREERVHAAEEWAEAERSRAQESLKTEEQREELLKRLGVIEAERIRLVERAHADAERKKQEQMTGTAAWAEKVNEQITASFMSTADAIGSALVETTGALRGAFDEMFEGLFSGDGDLMSVFENFTKNLQKIWSQRISDMFTKAITQGESLGSQFKGIWDSMQGGGVNGALAGAGVGSMVGGIFGSEDNHGGLGGTIGGAIGGAFGPLGGILGSLFGTLIGSLVEKSQDWINVAIQDGVTSVAEKGISREGRYALTGDIQDHLDDLTKGWTDLIEMFPEEVRERMRQAVGSIDATTRLEADDISDDSAFLMLSDFLNEELPAAVFDAYKPALEIGLEALGVETAQLGELMEYWGSLTGEELRAAVMQYVTVLTDSIELGDLLSAPFEDRLGEARRRSGMTGLDRIKEADSQIATAVASLAGLDLEDQVAAQARINDMARQRYEMEIQYLQQIDAIQKSIHDSIQAQREQIEMAGLDDPGKIEYIEERLNSLRTQLLSATDPQEIQELVQKIQGYVGQAFSLAPDDAALRDQLLGVLGDTEAFATEKLQAAREAAAAQDQLVADTMLEAAELLKGAADALTPGDPLPDPIDGDVPPPLNPDLPENQIGVTSDAVLAESHAQTALLEDIRSALEALKDQKPVIEVTGDVKDFMDGVGLALRAAAANDAIQTIRKNRRSIEGNF